MTRSSHLCCAAVLVAGCATSGATNPVLPARESPASHATAVADTLTFEHYTLEYIQPHRGQKRPKIVVERSPPLRVPPGTPVEGAEVVPAPLVMAELLEPVEIEGKRVEFLYHKHVDEETLKASCDGPARVVFIEPPANRSFMNEYTFLFFREHEAAHHREHMSCPLKEKSGADGKPLDKQMKELQADCAAYDALRQRYGRDAWGIMGWGVVQYWTRHPYPRGRGYPTVDERIRNLYYGCPTGRIKRRSDDTARL